MSRLKDEFVQRIRVSATPEVLMAAVYEEADAEIEQLAMELAEAVTTRLEPVDATLDRASAALTKSDFVESTRAIEQARRLLKHL